MISNPDVKYNRYYLCIAIPYDSLRYWGKGVHVMFRDTQFLLNAGSRDPQIYKRASPYHSEIVTLQLEEQSMRKTYIHFEVVAIEEAKKILEQEKRVAKREGNRKFVAEQSRRSPGERHAESVNSEVPGS